MEDGDQIWEKFLIPFLILKIKPEDILNMNLLGFLMG
jgi:hypothetical protein